MLANVVTPITADDTCNKLIWDSKRLLISENLSV